jgi:hypothetical protein
MTFYRSAEIAPQSCVQEGRVPPGRQKGGQRNVPTTSPFLAASSWCIPLQTSPAVHLRTLGYITEPTRSMLDALGAMPRTLARPALKVTPWPRSAPQVAPQGIPNLVRSKTSRIAFSFHVFLHRSWTENPGEKSRSTPSWSFFACCYVFSPLLFTFLWDKPRCTFELACQWPTAPRHRLQA